MASSRAVLVIVWATAPMLVGPAEADEYWPSDRWSTATPEETGMDTTALQRARDYALTGGGSGLVTRGGRLVISWGSATRLYDLKSTTKSIGITALGLAINDGKMKLSDKARRHHPGLGALPEENVKTGWLGDITIQHLATHTAGFDKPGGYTALLFAPGTKWSYSDGGPNWLAECVTLAYKKDLNTLMFDRVFGPLGIKPADLVWRENAYRPRKIADVQRREFGSGISANVSAMARIGYLYLRGGRWDGRQIIPRGFVDAVRTMVPAVKGLPVLERCRYPNASDHYGLLWWNNADGTLAGVPGDAYWSWGLYDSLIVVIPSLDIVVARAGAAWRDDRSADYSVLKPFLEPIVSSVQTALPRPSAPYPPSPVITGIDWAPSSTITRLASGSDNWPITWADDDHLYTAYGDGWGFDPKVPKKLSLGLAKIIGPPESFKGVNIRSPSGEQIGQGPAGKKASGMLMVDGILYMWVRNAGNSQLAWSTDHGESWHWSEWRFQTSFGCPTFLNFGKEHTNARDEYVYVYSHDGHSAYEPADRMVLARVHKDRIRNRGAYEFFKGLDGDGKALWAARISERGGVFTHAGRCYRSGITWNSGLGRYIWCQTLKRGDNHQNGGFGVYDASEPWGPWTTVYFTEEWDVGPGETCSFPTKWMSADGKVLHLAFSGDDSFSVRRATLVCRTPVLAGP